MKTTKRPYAVILTLVTGDYGTAQTVVTGTYSTREKARAALEAAQLRNPGAGKRAIVTR